MIWSRSDRPRDVVVSSGRRPAEDPLGGRAPRAADTVGINVYAVRYAAVILSGMLAAAGGAYLSIGFVNSFNENIDRGTRVHRPRRVIFGKLAAIRRARRRCLLFGFSSALAQRLARSTRNRPPCSSRRSRTSYG
jgi:simple sugar transport system permease protein